MIPRNHAIAKAQAIVQYLTPPEVTMLSNEALTGRKGKRNALLISLLFESGLRISEALSLTPSHIQTFENTPILNIVGKGKKRRMVSIPERLADRLRAYAYERKLEPKDRFFPINRSRAWQVIHRAAERAGLNKKVYPHLLRHSDAIERLRQSGNPKALQLHLGHSSMVMTMRYLSTLSVEDSVRINSAVKFDD